MMVCAEQHGQPYKYAGAPFTSDPTTIGHHSILRLHRHHARDQPLPSPISLIIVTVTAGGVSICSILVSTPGWWPTRRPSLPPCWRHPHPLWPPDPLHQTCGTLLQPAGATPGSPGGPPTDRPSRCCPGSAPPVAAVHGVAGRHGAGQLGRQVPQSDTFKTQGLRNSERGEGGAWRGKEGGQALVFNPRLHAKGMQNNTARDIGQSDKHYTPCLMTAHICHPSAIYTIGVGMTMVLSQPPLSFPLATTTTTTTNNHHHHQSLPPNLPLSYSLSART